MAPSMREPATDAERCKRPCASTASRAFPRHGLDKGSRSEQSLSGSLTGLGSQLKSGLWPLCLQPACRFMKICFCYPWDVVCVTPKSALNAGRTAFGSPCRMHLCLQVRFGYISCLFGSVWDAFEVRLKCNALQAHFKHILPTCIPNQPEGIPNASKTDRKRNLQMHPNASQDSETHI